MTEPVGDLRVLLSFNNPEPIPPQQFLDMFQKLGFTGAAAQTASTNELFPALLRNSDRIVYNPQKGQVVFMSPDNKELAHDLTQVIETLAKSPLVTLAEDIKSVEFSGEFKLLGTVEPLTAIAQLSPKNGVTPFNELLGETVTPFEIRFIPERYRETKKNMRDIPEWFDVSVSPFPVNPRFFLVRMAFRSTKPETMTKRIGDVQILVEKLVHAVEGG